ncbi:g9089 [Coccomyxa viridis]|uniref:G9089 protein n=1 Tax=Coccomyxa viridis TaxID=1274662 RepID=A0ABP1G230_9CHLO
MLEHFLGPFDDQLNAKGNTTITWEDLPMLDPAHLLGGQPQSPSLYPDGADHSQLFAFLDAIENGNEEAVGPPNGTPLVIAALPAIAPSNKGLMAAGNGQGTAVPQVVSTPPAQLAPSDQPSDTVQFLRPVVPKTSGLRTSTASFSISPSLRGMNTNSMRIFTRFCRLHKYEVGRRLDRPRPGAIAIRFAKVKRDPVIKTMLPSDCKVFLDELLRENLLAQPTQALLKSQSYLIGDNGLWMMNHSRLQSLGSHS